MLAACGNTFAWRQRLPPFFLSEMLNTGIRLLHLRANAAGDALKLSYFAISPTMRPHLPIMAVFNTKCPPLSPSLRAAGEKLCAATGPGGLLQCRPLF
jgi:hypothetical protein